MLCALLNKPAALCCTWRTSVTGDMDFQHNYDAAASTEAGPLLLRLLEEFDLCSALSSSPFSLERFFPLSLMAKAVSGVKCSACKGLSQAPDVP